MYVQYMYTTTKILSNCRIVRQHILQCYSMLLWVDMGRPWFGDIFLKYEALRFTIGRTSWKQTFASPQCIQCSYQNCSAHQWFQNNHCPLPNDWNHWFESSEFPSLDYPLVKHGKQWTSGKIHQWFSPNYVPINRHKSLLFRSITWKNIFFCLDV